MGSCKAMVSCEADFSSRRTHGFASAHKILTVLSNTPFGHCPAANTRKQGTIVRVHVQLIPAPLQERPTASALFAQRRSPPDRMGRQAPWTEHRLKCNPILMHSQATKEVGNNHQPPRAPTSQWSRATCSCSRQGTGVSLLSPNSKTNRQHPIWNMPNESSTMRNGHSQPTYEPKLYLISYAVRCRM
jgi:hypothetical protein